MTKYKMFGLVLVAVFALSALIASTAGAVEFLLAEWLAAGAKITTAQASFSEGELEFVANNGGGFGVKSAALCRGFLDGTSGPVSADEITKLLNVKGEEVSSTPLVGTGIECTNDKNCEKPKMWVVGLPWKTEIELMIDEGKTFFVDLITSTQGYYFQCTVLGITIAEECTTSQTGIEATNEAGGAVDMVFSDIFQTLAGNKLANCTLGGTETGEVIGLFTLLLTSGAALTVSSE